MGLPEVETVLRKLSVLANKTSEFLLTLPQPLTSLIKQEDSERILSHRKRVSRLCEIIARQTSKVVFFGRTSSGKSTVINALLGESVLPSGLGHTTSNFVTITGTEELNPSQLQTPEMLSVELLWPVTRCRLLRHKVQLIDSPGINMEENFDQWMESEYLDSDIFVLVVNAESTIMMKEKEFVLNASQKFATPNVIVLFNRWDCTFEAEEFIIDAVHDQHVKRATQFLVALMAISEKEAEERIFFLSAKEILKRNRNSSNDEFQFGGNQCLEEWKRFEDFLISQVDKSTSSNVRNKSIVDVGAVITSDLENFHLSMFEFGAKKLKEIHSEKLNTDQNLEHVKSTLEDLRNEEKPDFQELQDEIEKLVVIGFRDEIETIDEMIANCDTKFLSDQAIVTHYIQQLIGYVEFTISQNLRLRLSNQIWSEVDTAKSCVLVTHSELFTDEKHDRLVSIMEETRHKDIEFSLGLSTLLSNFNPDLEFRFSLAPNKILKIAKSFFENFKSWLHKEERRKEPSGGEVLTPFWPRTVLKLVLATYLTCETSAALACTGLACRSFAGRAGLTILASTSMAYITVYVFERLIWQVSTRERHLQRQFIAEIVKKMPEMEELLVLQIRQKVSSEISSFTRQASEMFEALELELSERSEKLFDELEHLSESRKTTQEMLDTLENIRISLKRLKK